MFFFVLISLSCISLIRSQEGEVVPSENRTECVNKLVQWCNSMQYPEQGSHGMSMVAISYHSEEGYQRVLCASDSEGTNCTRNGSPWFACSPDHSLTYKGEVLTSSSTDVDDGICDAASKVNNQLYLGSSSFNNESLTDFQNYMGSFFEAMAQMQEQMMELQRQLSRIPFMNGGGFGGGFGGGDWGEFDGGFFSDGGGKVTTSPDDNNSDDANRNDSKDTNQIEKE